MPKEPKLRIVESIIRSCSERIVQGFIAKLKALPAATEKSNGTSGYGLADLWEEYKYQFQSENTDFNDRYDHVVRPLCRDAVAALPCEVQQLLWLDTEHFDDLDTHNETVTLDDFDSSVIADYIYDRLRDIANNEPLAYDPDQERGSDDYPPGG